MVDSREKKMAQQNNPKKPSKLLIYCEGETEKQYLTALAEALKITPNVSIRKTAACSPIQLLESAYKDYQWSQIVDKQYPFTEYWLVFDRDHHPSYADTFNLAATMDPKPHLAWTNPCIEFWFWLHYCGNRANLKFDEETEVSNVRTEKALDNDEVEITTVRRVRRTIKPETMLKLLRGYVPGYSKVVCSPGLVSRSGTACDNLVKVAQSKNPMAIGSALPELLLRLANLQDEIHPPKAPVGVGTTQTSAVAPSNTETKLAPQTPKVPTPPATATQKPPADQPKPVETKIQPIEQKAASETAKTAVPPVTLTITVKAPTGKTTVIPLTEKPTVGNGSESSKLGSTSLNAPSTPSSPSHKEPETPTGTTATRKKPGHENPRLQLLEYLKLCLRDWAFIRVKVSGLECPSGTLAHWEQFFTQTAVLSFDCKTRDRANIGLGALKNIRKLITASKTAPNKDRAEKIAGRLYALGGLLTFFAQDFGISELLKGLSFAKQTPVDDVTLKAAAVRPATPAVPQPKTTPSSVKGSPADASEDKTVDGKTPTFEPALADQKLKEATAALKEVQQRFSVVMSGLVGVTGGVKAYEMLPGLCERGGTLQEDAVRILNTCAELVSAAPSLNKGEG